MRRKDREMPEDFAWIVADKCEWAVMSMIGKDNLPYCIPISIVRIDDVIYFHSAMEGEKISCLKQNNNVCLSCVGDTYRLPNDFTTEYESAIIKGQAYEVTEDIEKIAALKALCIRHTPTNMVNFDSAIERSLFRTAVWGIKVKSITGKRKKYDNMGKEMKFGRME